MCMYLLWFCLFPDTPHYLVQKWDLFNMARAQRVRRGGQPDKEMETLPRTTTKDTVILHINHTLRTSVWRSRIFFNPAMVSSGLHTYQFLLLVHLQCYPFWCHPFQFIAHSCTFFFTNLSLCSFNISFIFAFFLLPPHILCLFDCACTCLSITECRFCLNVLNVLQAEREHLYLGKRRSSYTVRESYCHERLWSYK